MKKLRSRIAPRHTVASLLVAAGLAAAFLPGTRAGLAAPEAPPAGGVTACGQLTAPVLSECSGIVASRRYAGVFWVHNDSGDRARFYAVDSSGELLSVVAVDGARNVDWEDIAIDDSGQVYLGDIGNNLNERRDLVVYVVDEPDPHRGPGPLHVPVRRRLPFHFADQETFPDSAHLNFDCEALGWNAGHLYLLTKHRSDTATTLYRLDPWCAGEQVAERVGGVRMGSPVTAADCSPDGRLLGVLTYRDVSLFERPAAGDNYLAGRRSRLPISAGQCEGICFDGDRLLVTSEQRGIYCLPLSALRPPAGRHGT